MCERWRRHDLLRVRPRAWSRILEARSGWAEIPQLAQWAERDWPLIVRRRSQDDAAGVIPVAVPLPPASGKLRLALQLAPDDIVGPVPPLALRRVNDETPRSWRSTVDALLAIAEQTGVEPYVFGSLLWQRLTDLPYLSAGSDLDLLWAVTHLDAAMSLVRRLGAVAAHSAVRIDGEILLPDGGGVQWRELQAGGAEVLVKTSVRVELRPVAALFSTAAQERTCRRSTASPAVTDRRYSRNRH